MLRHAAMDVCVSPHGQSTPSTPRNELGTRWSSTRLTASISWPSRRTMQSNVQQQREGELYFLDLWAEYPLPVPGFSEQYWLPSAPSPSAKEGATPAEEQHWRESGAALIQAVGMTTRMSQYAIGHASALHHLFFMNRSVLKSDRLIVVMAALVLAGKIQEPQRLAKQIIDTTWKLRYAHSPEEADLIHKQEVFTGVREAVGKAERALMYMTGCRLEAALPYDAILRLVEAAGLHALYPDLHVLAWNLCNDSWRTLVSLQHRPDHVAACCILAACAIAGVQIPPRLWELPAVQELQPGTLRGMALEILGQYKAALQKAGKQSSSPRQDQPGLVKSASAEMSQPNSVA